MKPLNFSARCLLAGLCVAVFCVAGWQLAPAGSKPPRQIIFMVPDGMGLANVTIARTYLNGPDSGRLSFESLPYIGYQRTTSKNSYVTDSAAAASAWASGEKFKNGEISCVDSDGDGRCDGSRKNAATVLEMAQAAGMAAGLVATSDITHATPAAWGAHVHSRKCESEIFAQLIAREIDVLLGGGLATNRGPCRLDKTDPDDNRALLRRAKQQGYTYVTDKTALADAAGADKLLGLFKKGGLTPIYQRDSQCSEPTLTEMTTAALDSLADDPDGFFLMVEGSQIDWANHARHLDYQIHETLDFHHAVQAVVDWMDAEKQREKNTLLIVVADHETGGVIIEGPCGKLPEAGDADSQAVTFASNGAKPLAKANHTAVDTLIWSNHPACAGAHENTDLFYIMKDFLNNH